MKFIQKMIDKYQSGSKLLPDIGGHASCKYWNSGYG